MKFVLMLSRADIANIRRACTIAKNMELRNAEECNNKTADRILADRPWHLKRADDYQFLIDNFDSCECTLEYEDL